MSLIRAIFARAVQKEIEREYRRERRAQRFAVQALIAAVAEQALALERKSPEPYGRAPHALLIAPDYLPGRASELAGGSNP
jgi:sugar (pentulose or hexulose) kinase